MVKIYSAITEDLEILTIWKAGKLTGVATVTSVDTNLLAPGRSAFLPFLQAGTEVQRGEASCPGSHSTRAQSQDCRNPGTRQAPENSPREGASLQGGQRREQGLGSVSPTEASSSARFLSV